MGIFERLGWRTPPVIKAEPAVTPTTFRDDKNAASLLRFSRDEMEIGITKAWALGNCRPTMAYEAVEKLALDAVARHRREKNRLARKQSKPAPAPVVEVRE
jgi:hypothetical protein